MQSVALSEFPAFFDTNVLYGALLNDFILELADRGLFRPIWSKDVLYELAKNLVKNGDTPTLVKKRLSMMERYFADANLSSRSTSKSSTPTTSALTSSTSTTRPNSAPWSNSSKNMTLRR